MRVKRGYDYYIAWEKIKEYRNKTPEQRLQWLYYGNLFRRQYPKEIIKTQERFRDEERGIN